MINTMTPLNSSNTPLNAGEISSSPDGSSDNLVSNHARLLFQCFGFAVICQSISIFGTVANIINIICFFKLGFKDPVNVSLFGLAVSDLGCLITLIWLNISFTPVFQLADLPFDAFELQYLTGGWPHVIFARISSWITALITLERCLCITVPLKVKTIVTSKRVSIIIACVFAILTCSVTPVYCVNRFANKFYPERNRTILGIVYTADRESVEKISLVINIIVHFAAFFIVLICTIILVIKLQRKTEWRKRATSLNNSNSIATRDQNIAKMIVMISTFFIVCFTPVCISIIAMLVEPEYAILGRYKNLYILIFGLGFILESSNSSVNIFIYHRMSTRYRTVFAQLFCKQVHDGPNNTVGAPSKQLSQFG